MLIKAKKIVVVITIVATLPFLLGFTYSNFEIQEASNKIVQLARSIGLHNSDPIIVRAQEVWRAAYDQFLIDRDIIATVVYNEAGYGCSDRHMELVAAVIYNRLKSDKFPETIYEIVTAPKQYHPLYADADSFYGQLARDSDKWAQCRRIAVKALRGEIKCPDNVFYQANFKQGDGVYEVHYTSYSTTWFCYGEE